MGRWTDEQVDALRVRQADGRFHPYTCPGGSTACDGNRNLIPTPDGWVCHCGRYTQDWAHEIKDPTP